MSNTEQQPLYVKIHKIIHNKRSNSKGVYITLPEISTEYVKIRMYWNPSEKQKGYLVVIEPYQ